MEFSDEGTFRARRLKALWSAAALLWLAPTLAAQVEVDVEVTGDAVPGGSVTATATITTMETVTGYSWTFVDGVAAGITGGQGTNAVTLTLGPLADYKTRLLEVLVAPPVDAEDLPPNVPLHAGEFSAGLQNRFEVVGLNPFMIEETGLVELELEVTTNVDLYIFIAEIYTTLPWKPTTGLRNVPIGIPVLLHGKQQASYDWTLDAPAGSGAALIGATSRNPEFIPDVDGEYAVSVTELAPASMVAEKAALSIFAGTWHGIIEGQDDEGRPEVSGSCNACHGNIVDKWRETGHAEIFTDSLNTNNHYGSYCFSCHTIGFDPDTDNGGADEAPDYQAFLASGLLGAADPTAWDQVLADFEDFAQMTNAQCESCHGPQDSDAHMSGGARRNISANVCAPCHGEPLRHARFQQWQLSKHAAYELAIDESQIGSCSRCHTANGFLTWLPILLDDDPGTDPTADVTVDWTEDEVHPQTCVTCHDPHMTGTTSGVNSNAYVHIVHDTPQLIAGFTATDVGRGAICMTCHNSRRGLNNDAVFAYIYGTLEASRAPHGSAQADVLMGQNAYFVEVGNRGNHSLTSLLPDTCVTCHMEATPPPDVLSYNQGGSNHTFFASLEICGDCHSEGLGEVVQGATMAILTDLEEDVEEAILELINDQIEAGNSIDLGGAATLDDVGDVAELQIADFRGRQAITVTLVNDAVVGPTGMNRVHVVPLVGDPFDLYNVANPNLVKAGWNYWLAFNDGSYGVHNPSFIANLLYESIAALEVDPLIFTDGFESGDTAAWTRVVP